MARLARERHQESGRAGVSTELGAARLGADTRFFGAEGERIARLCRHMAERFARGGRLLAVARSPRGWSDAPHVAGEVLHPGVLGQGAPPAFALPPQAPAPPAQPGDKVV